MNYIRNMLDRMGRRSGFGWQDVDGFWGGGGGLGELCHMERWVVQECAVCDRIGGRVFNWDRTGWQR